MSPAPADRVNAVELAERAATLERELHLGQLPRLVEAGALQGTRVHARLTFGTFEARPVVDLRLDGVLVATCQRCLKPCERVIDESALVAIVASDADDVPGGYEQLVGDAERLSLAELIEEQALLGMPLVPMHEAGVDCGAAKVAKPAIAAEPAEEKQRPFANLRELLDKGER